MRTMMLCIGPAAVAGALALAACTTPPSRTAATSPAVHPPAAPQPVSMDPSLALGLWHSSFGAVKIEQDTGRGTDAVMGVWIYQRDGEEVMGFFSGTMRGNVLDFNWHEPAPAGDLTGGGYLAFDPQGGRFNGTWWTRDRSRGNTWYGWRADRAGAGPDPGSQGTGGIYGGQGYGGAGDTSGIYGEPSDAAGQPPTVPADTTGY